MQYTFTCAEHNAVLTADAKNDSEALKKLTKAAKEHMRTAHSGSKPMTDKEIEQMLCAGWKKEAKKEAW